jgi:hypothetical protein
MRYLWIVKLAALLLAQPHFNIDWVETVKPTVAQLPITGW